MVIRPRLVASRPRCRSSSAAGSGSRSTGPWSWAWSTSRPIRSPTAASFCAPHAAIAHARRLIEEGADIVDIGGESSRPGRRAGRADEELERVVPVLERCATRRCPLSIDTAKPEVMRAAHRRRRGHGERHHRARSAARRSRRSPRAIARCASCTCRASRAPCSRPRLRGRRARGEDFLSRARGGGAERAGIAREPHRRSTRDSASARPSSTTWSCCAACAELAGYRRAGAGGLSRKSMLGRITGRPAGDRLPASVAAALLAVRTARRSCACTTSPPRATRWRSGADRQPPGYECQRIAVTNRLRQARSRR